MVGRAHYLVSNQINLPASAGICNSLFPRLLGHASLHFYAENVPAKAQTRAGFVDLKVWVPTHARTVRNELMRGANLT